MSISASQFIPLLYPLVTSYTIIIIIIYYYYICYDDLWSVIFDVTVIIVLGHHKPCPYKIVDLSAISSDFSTDLTATSPTLSLLGLPIPWDTTILKLGQY